MTHDLRTILRVAQNKEAQPAAAIFDSHKKKNGSKTHIAVDTLGYLLALVVTPANEQERAQVGALCERVQEVTDSSVKIAWADQGYTGEEVAKVAKTYGIALKIVKLPEAKKGFVLLPRRWVVDTVSSLTYFLA